MSEPTGLVAEFVKAFDIANVEMMVVSLPDTTVVAATRAAAVKWNCGCEELVGRQIVKYGTGPLSARYIGDDQQGSVRQRIEVSYTPPLGAMKSNVFTPQSWSDGGRDFMILIGQHASQQLAEDAVRNERRLSLALKSGGYAVWDHDFRSGKSHISPELYDLLGFGRDDGNVDFTSFNELIHPEDRDKTLEDQIRAAPFGNDLFQTRYRVRTRSGDYIWLESVAGVIRDPIDGRPSKCVGLSRNVNDQMAALERLRASERVLRRSQQAAKLGSFSLKTETNVSRMSSEMITLLGLEDAVVQPTLRTFQGMIEPADRIRFADALDKARAGQRVTDLEIAVRSKSGDMRHLSCSIEPESSQQGSVEMLFGTCQCITDRKALERKFLQAQKMEAVGQLTGGVAHDFNNLLMVVMGNLQLVEQLVKSDDRAVKRIRAAIDAAEKGSELTKRMLAFSRQQTLQNKELKVNDLVLRMQDMIHHAITANVDLKIIPGENLLPVKADATMLETAILNLSINARDAMKDKGGDLIVETANRTLDAAYCAKNEDVQPGDYVEIAVTDTGCGIAPENIEKVFQPFFTTKPPEAGSGLGLSMIYGFVKQSGGHIKIYSEVGHGTTVKIYLPSFGRNAPAATDETDDASPAVMTFPDLRVVAETPPVSEAAPEPQHPAEQKAQLQIRRPVVLVVEDNPSVREVAAAMIEDMGFETLLASSGTEGLRIIEQRGDIDLVLSDVIMAGGMNGPELAMKALRVRPQLKVLFMSGYAPGSVRQMQDLPDSIDLVNKPFTRNDLTEKVKRALAA